MAGYGRADDSVSVIEHVVGQIIRVAGERPLREKGAEIKLRGARLGVVGITGADSGGQRAEVRRFLASKCF